MVPRSALDCALPVDDVLLPLRRALSAERAVVLQAPPGAGKTTRVPLALLDEPWLAGQRLIMLEPRRLAARAAARRMAATLGEPVGRTVGFRVRGETRVSTQTRIEVVTEGVLTRLLHADPSLDGIGLVVFDEFHERSVHADLGLALALQSCEILRPDLRLLVMSATLDVQAVSSLLGGAPVLRSEGRAFPVEIRYLPRRGEQRVEGAVAAAIRAALAQDAGSVLAFLPGAGEIGRTAELLEAALLPRDVRVYPLFGDLPLEMQDAAIRPAGAGERKVVLATSIAETSLTIDGIRIVVDGGLIRAPRFSPRSGMTRLETMRVSRASAEQRRGRAGRTAPGICYRLWALEEQAGLLERSTPEILETDLTSLALDLAEAGIGDTATLRWIDPPPAPALAQARSLLSELEAIERSGRITPHGRAMLGLGVHPRLAHMLLRAREFGHGATACAMAALLDERDVLRQTVTGREADLRLRVGMLVDDERSPHLEVDRSGMRRVRERYRVLRAQMNVPADEVVAEEASGWLLALAYPDRVAQRRTGAGDRFLMRNGRGVVLEAAGALAGAPFLAIADLDGRVPESRVFLAAPVERQDVERLFTSQLVREDVVKWDAAAGAIVARRRESLGAIVLRDAPLRDVDEPTVAQVLLRALARGEGLALHWSEGARQLRSRLVFLRQFDPEWPDAGEPALAGTIEAWLLPHLTGLRRREQVEQLDPATMLLDLLTWQQRLELDRLAPTHVAVPTGSNIRIDYGDPESPVLAVRLQELFGLAETPRIAAGRVPLTLHLLSPARRLVQVTRDLAGFWRTSYFEVRRDLRGRYPKHEWPDDPLAARPTRRARPRR